MQKVKETAVDYLVKELSAILGALKTTAMQDLLIVDAINKAKQMEKEQIGEAGLYGCRVCLDGEKSIHPDEHYQNVYGILAK
jgi:hypothetical protein